MSMKTLNQMIVQKCSWSSHEVIIWGYRPEMKRNGNSWADKVRGKVSPSDSPGVGGSPSPSASSPQTQDNSSPVSPGPVLPSPPPKQNGHMDDVDTDGSTTIEGIELFSICGLCREINYLFIALWHCKKFIELNNECNNFSFEWHIDKKSFWSIFSLIRWWKEKLLNSFLLNYKNVECQSPKM